MSAVTHAPILKKLKPLQVGAFLLELLPLHLSPIETNA